LLFRQTNIGNVVQGDIWDSPVLLYPATTFHVNPNAPAAVRTSLAEATKAFAAGAFTASALMCRRAIEALCAAHNAPKGTLAARLKALKDTNIISDHLFQWADMLRMAGNQAAHDVDEAILRTDAEDMLDFTSAIVDYVYSYRDKFEAFKQRRARP
jgi:hypothetical protein